MMEPPLSPTPPRERDYFVTYDPVLQPMYRDTKGKQPIYRYEREGLSDTKPKDPRRLLSAEDKLGRGRGRYRKEVYFIEYPPDSDNAPVRKRAPTPPLPCALSFINIPTSLPSSTLHRHLQNTFGFMNDFTFPYDPLTGQAYGLLWIKFASHQFASQCLASAEAFRAGKTAQNGVSPFFPPGNWDPPDGSKKWMSQLKATWDDSGEEHKRLHKLEESRRRKAWEDERRKKKEEDKTRRDKEREMRLKNAMQQECESRSAGLDTPLGDGRTGSSTPATLAEQKKSPGELAREEAENVRRKREIRKKLAHNRYEHLIFEGACVDDEADLREIAKVLDRFGVEEVITDSLNVYVTFSRPSSAQRAEVVLSNAQQSQTSASASLRLPSAVSSARMLREAPLDPNEEKAEQERVIKEASDELVEELKRMVRKDLRELARGTVLETVRQFRAEKKDRLAAQEATTAPVSITPRILDMSALKGMKIMKKGGEKKRLTEGKVMATHPVEDEMEVAKSKPVKVSPVEPVVMPEDEEEPMEIDAESDDDKAAEDLIKTVLKKRKASTVEPELERASKKRKAEIDFTDSEGEEETPTPVAVEVRAPSPVAPIPPPAKKKSASRKRKVEVVPSPTDESNGTTLAEELEDQQALLEEDMRPTKKRKMVSPPASVSDVLDPVTGDLDLYKLGFEDEEDAYQLRILLTGKGSPEPEEEEPESTGDDVILPPRHPDRPVHHSGSARTEGFYKIPAALKASYLPQRNTTTTDVPKTGDASKSRSNKGITSRANRNLNRNATRAIAMDMERSRGGAAPSSELFAFNQLRARKKELKFARSPIHDWGLYALEYIPAGDMVIEYVGEVVRQQVADKREKVYERQGIGSSYLFRIDDDLVVDATMKGNIGRLINHSCSPNCTARIITINSSKKIVIYAKTPIEPGEEITYDYHFPIEQEKIPCLCGSEKCRGFLN